MKALIDIAHPAHVHFFRNPIRLLQARGHSVVVTSRDKDVTLDLLDRYKIEHRCLGVAAGGGLWALGRELISRDLKLLRCVKQEKPDVLAAIGGTFVAHAGRLSGTPSIVFYDTEFATLQNRITYPFTDCIVVPECYYGKLPSGRSMRYTGYHELSYLHPRYFQPDAEIARRNGIDPGRENFLVRIVSWQANHDIGEAHWSEETLGRLVDYLKQRGNVIISSEATLPSRFAPFLYQGDTSALHHVLANCRAYVGESATLASEAAVLGVPALYVATSDRGYTNEQSRKYGLTRHLDSIEWPTLHDALGQLFKTPVDEFQRNRQQLLGDCVDVAGMVYRCIESIRPCRMNMEAMCAE